ncbi:class I SAM-dependent methyltransferase [Flavivirga eckloniae]|uniref:Methyltransferase domain-containing protein n=1 Tax=Flavivirga eckloniae TaxID=1803846 RepID=A0A2K9PVG1_9FLAO|nr:class I SAM-dependent methyltransferase [Flavivirga eckloniae]AUP81066.1 hypothetical protein C1H87_21045 [Flavivirga eckloniae]
MENQEYYKMYQQENEFWWYKILHNIVKQFILKSFPKGDLKIFDAGCGTGRMIEVLQPFGDVSGLDFSTEAVSFSKERGLKNIYQGDINTWEFKENSYDVIISLDVLYHESIIDEKIILKRMYNGLKDNGILILNLPAFNHLKREHDICVQTKKRFTRKPTNKTLKQLNFKILKSTYRIPLLYFVILALKLKRKIVKPKTTQSDLNMIAKPINGFFTFLGALENKYISKIGSLPLGSSLFIVAKKMSDDV